MVIQFILDQIELISELLKYSQSFWSKKNILI